MDDDLKTCPFCGSPGIKARRTTNAAYTYVECDGCNAMGPDETEVATWNTRPTEDALRERVKVLDDAVCELVDALDAVDAEAERAEQPGATAWSSAPVVRSLYARKAARAALKDAEAEPCGECHLKPGETCDICGRKRTAT